MKLVLVRHGDTFAPGDKVVWVGRAQDLALVESGRLQASQVGQMLRDCGYRPSAIYAAPLKRTREFAKILGETAAPRLQITTDERLYELDYGAWGGLSSDEVRAHFGNALVDAWEKEGKWPEACKWGESEQAVLKRLTSFLVELEGHSYADPVVLVTSNGILRFFLKICAEAEYSRRLREGKLKVRTGAICILDIGRSTTVLDWDRRPGDRVL
ncbi:MAG: histidine phosphatase family protein [Oligoflexia bacterium]|nr:histidine phosphatase family protein [Oligoflexia bacterium]